MSESTTAEQSIPKTEKLHEASLNRRFLKLLTASFEYDEFWDLIGVAGGLYFWLAPLEKELRRRARKYRSKPNKFSVSFERLVQRRRFADPVYDQKFQWFSLFASRLSSHFREPNPAESQHSRLTKYQAQKKAEILELLGFFLPLPGRVPSDRDVERITKTLSELAKPGPGRTPENKLLLEQAIALHEKRAGGYRTIARQLCPSASSKEIDKFAGSIADAVRYRRKLKKLVTTLS
jgi:hypothetical protein